MAEKYCHFLSAPLWNSWRKWDTPMNIKQTNIKEALAFFSSHRMATVPVKYWVCTLSAIWVFTQMILLASKVPVLEVCAMSGAMRRTCSVQPTQPPAHSTAHSLRVRFYEPVRVILPCLANKKLPPFSRLTLSLTQIEQRLKTGEHFSKTKHSGTLLYVSYVICLYQPVRGE